MSVIVELTLPPGDFELGQILGVEDETRVVLETLVPMGNKSIPFVRVFGGREYFAESVRDAAPVEDLRVVSTHDDEILYALDWDVTEDRFIAGLEEFDGTIMEATGSETNWAFELRFESHDSLSAFQAHCRQEGFPIEIVRLYNPTKPDAGPWFGLTPAQRTTLIRAVEAGYYEIPRKITTRELAEEFDVSDQAVTERLRRAIVNLVANTVQVSAEYAKTD